MLATGSCTGLHALYHTSYLVVVVLVDYGRPGLQLLHCSHADRLGPHTPCRGDNGLTGQPNLSRPKPCKPIISVDCSLEICLWKETGMLKFALRPESIELSHSFVLTHCLQVAQFFASNQRWLQIGKVLECTSNSLY